MDFGLLLLAYVFQSVRILFNTDIGVHQGTVLRSRIEWHGGCYLLVFEAQGGMNPSCQKKKKAVIQEDVQVQSMKTCMEQPSPPYPICARHVLAYVNKIRLEFICM